MINSVNTLSNDALMAIQNGTMAYEYRGIETYKNPFDLAIYPLLLARLRPQTIIEIGSHHGGSALWLADQMTLIGASSHVHSFDILPVNGVNDPRISFHLHGGGDLGTTITPAMRAAMPHPWLVIEDADHQYETVLANLRFFAPFLKQGDYVAVEDGILTQMGVADLYGGGPLSAIHTFMAEQPDLFEIDRSLCDTFGHNMTWNTDGYLRRL